MKVLNDLLPYMGLYYYDFETERLILKASEKSAEAAEAYNRAVIALIGDPKDSKSDFCRPVLLGLSEIDDVYKTPVGQWEMDIAIDCVRKMSEDDRQYMCDHPWTTEYHHGYGTWIRNKYIHPTRLHRSFRIDRPSTNMVLKMFSILIPGFDYRNKDIVEYFDSFVYQDLHKHYGESEKEIFDSAAEKMMSGESALTVEEAIEELRKTLAEKLGKEEFIRIFKEYYMEDYQNDSWDEDKRRRFWQFNFKSAVVLFPLEHNQLRCLKMLGLIKDIDEMKIRSQKECRKFIDTQLGLKKQSAELMAKCCWEACDPISNGTWVDSPLWLMNAGYSIEDALKENDIDCLGDLCDKTYRELAALPDIGEENAKIIRKSLKRLGLRLKSD